MKKTNNITISLIAALASALTHQINASETLNNFEKMVLRHEEKAKNIDSIHLLEVITKESSKTNPLINILLDIEQKRISELYLSDEYAKATAYEKELKNRAVKNTSDKSMYLGYKISTCSKLREINKNKDKNIAFEILSSSNKIDSNKSSKKYCQEALEDMKEFINELQKDINQYKSQGKNTEEKNITLIVTLTYLANFYKDTDGFQSPKEAAEAYIKSIIEISKIDPNKDKYPELRELAYENYFQAKKADESNQKINKLSKYIGL